MRDCAFSDFLTHGAQSVGRGHIKHQRLETVRDGIGRDDGCIDVVAAYKSALTAIDAIKAKERLYGMMRLSNSSEHDQAIEIEYAWQVELRARKVAALLIDGYVWQQDDAIADLLQWVNALLSVRIDFKALYAPHLATVGVYRKLVLERYKVAYAKERKAARQRTVKRNVAKHRANRTVEQVAVDKAKDRLRKATKANRLSESELNAIRAEIEQLAMVRDTVAYAETR